MSRAVSPDIDPQRKVVHEKTYQVFHLDPVAIGYKCPDAKIRLSGIAVEQNVEGGYHQHRHRGAFASNKCL